MQSNADEFRFLTFLFCDLVDSTPISQALSHEDWRTVLSRFQATCIEQVELQGGVVYEFQGDGFLFYFGYPIAKEDCASRAADAGLAIIRQCQHGHDEVNTLLADYEQPGLRVRIGIHSDYVVVGTKHGRDLATGFALAFTQRLSTCAAPNNIVISNDTRQLLAKRFVLSNLGKKQLKGIADPVDCYQVIDNSKDQQSVAEISKFVGRNTEKDWLESRWLQATEGCGSSCVVSGEPGIGKSRLVKEFVNSLPGQSDRVLLWRCSPSHSHSALYPVMQGVTQYLVQLEQDQSGKALHRSSQQAGDLQSASSKTNVRTAHQALTGWLKSEAERASASTAAISSEEKKHETLSTIVKWLVMSSQQQPICLVLEDVHWIDPSTKELVLLLNEQLPDSHLLLIMTCRSQRDDDSRETFISEFLGLFSRQTLTIEKLPRHSAYEMARSVIGPDRLSDEVIAQLVDRSDGIPLFIEESSAILAESGQMADEPVAGSSPLSLLTDVVPNRLMDLLTVRLSSAGDARHTATLAACIGRQFSRNLLTTASELDTSSIDYHLQELNKKGLIKPHESDPDILLFKHALVRDAAYGTLLDSSRRQCHLAIANALVSQRSSDAMPGQETVAWHYTFAGEYERAIKYWLLAGRLARMNANPNEALSHYRQSKELISEIHWQDETSRETTLLQIYLGLGSCFIALDGYASDDARECYERADELLGKGVSSAQQLKIHFGLEVHYFMRGNFAKALRYARSCHEQAGRHHDSLSPDSDKKIIAHADLTLAQSKWALGNVLFHQGLFSKSRPLMEDCIRLCSTYSRSDLAMVHDPEVMSQLYLSWQACEEGRMNEALSSVVNAVEQSETGGHAYTLGMALAFRACIHFFRCEYRQAIQYSNESISYSEKPGFKTWFAWAKVLKGRSLCAFAESRREGLAEVEAGLELWESSGAIVTRPFTLTLLAESLILNSEYENAEMHIDAALDIVDQFGERYYEAEIYRVSALIRLKKSDPDRALAISHLQRSLELAAQRGFYRTALRSALLLANTQLEAGQSPQTLDLIRSSLHEISCDANYVDFKEANRILSLPCIPGSPDPETMVPQSA